MTKENIKRMVLAKELILQVKNTKEHNDFLNYCFPSRKFIYCDDTYYWASSEMYTGYNSARSSGKEDLPVRFVKHLDELLGEVSYEISINLNLI